MPCSVQIMSLQGILVSLNGITLQYVTLQIFQQYSNLNHHLIMKFRFTMLLRIGLLSLFTINLCAQSFSVVVDSVEVQTGSTLCVPVRAKGFVKIASFQYSLQWDGSIITFSGVQNIQLPGISGTYIGLSPVTQNTLIVAWSDTSGICVTIPDDAILYEVCFQAIGAEGSNSNIKPGSLGFPPSAGGAEAYNCSFEDIWSLAGCVPGHVEVLPKSSSSITPKNSPQTFLLSPNPTHSGSTLILESAESETQYLVVTNVLGQTVLEQNIQVTVGENRFEIPSSALNAKGIYQVILQTADGVYTRRLSVQ